MHLLRQPGFGAAAEGFGQADRHFGRDAGMAVHKFGQRLAADAANEIRMSDEVVEAVTRKWASYGLPGTGKSIW